MALLDCVSSDRSPDLLTLLLHPARQTVSSKLPDPFDVHPRHLLPPCGHLHIPIANECGYRRCDDPYRLLQSLRVHLLCKLCPLKYDCVDEVWAEPVNRAVDNCVSSADLIDPPADRVQLELDFHYRMPRHYTTHIHIPYIWYSGKLYNFLKFNRWLLATASMDWVMTTT